MGEIESKLHELASNMIRKRWQCELKRGMMAAMADWTSRSEITGDVVFFRYASLDLEKNVETVFIWDLDQTYLDTAINSLSGLLQTVLEKAFTKKNIPATNTLLQSLAEERKIQAANQMFFPCYFITASPPQMEERIAEKFKFDEIFPLGCFYKDNLKNLRPGRFWRLRKQVGYKLQSLLQLRTRLSPDVRQICFGDDSESDAIIYNLYSDICARRLSTSEIRQVLTKFNVTGDQVDTILMLQSQIVEQDPIEKIYINLATDTDPEYYLRFGRRTLPTYNTFQIALDLYQDGRLKLPAVSTIAQDMIYNYNYTPEELLKGMDDLIRRRVLGERAFLNLRSQFMAQGMMDEHFLLSMQPLKEQKVVDNAVYELEGLFEPWVPERIDYLNDYR